MRDDVSERGRVEILPRNPLDDLRSSNLFDWLARPRCPDVRIVRARNIDARLARQLAQNFLAGGPAIQLGPRVFSQRPYYSVHCSFHITEEIGVEEGHQWLRVPRLFFPSDYQRVRSLPFNRINRHSGQIEHLQDRGAGQLIRIAHSDHVELTDRSLGFEGSQGFAGRPQRDDQIRPWCENSLHQNIGESVQGRIHGVD